MSRRMSILPVPGGRSIALSTSSTNSKENAPPAQEKFKIVFGKKIPIQPPVKNPGEHGAKQVSTDALRQLQKKLEIATAEYEMNLAKKDHTIAQLKQAIGPHNRVDTVSSTPVTQTEDRGAPLRETSASQANNIDERITSLRQAAERNRAQAVELLASVQIVADNLRNLS